MDTNQPQVAEETKIQTVNTSSNSANFSIGEAISFGWKTATSNLVFFIVLGLLSIVISSLIGSIQNGFKDQAGPILFLIQIVSFIISSIITINVLRINLGFVDGKKPEYVDLIAFDGKKLLNYILATILYALMVFVGFILLVIPGIYLAIRFGYYPYFITDKNAGIMESFKLSSNATSGLKLEIFGFLIVCLFILIAGLLAFGIGLILAYPTVLIAQAYVYRKLSSQIKA